MKQIIIQEYNSSKRLGTLWIQKTWQNITLGIYQLLFTLNLRCEVQKVCWEVAFTEGKGRKQDWASKVEMSHWDADLETALTPQWDTTEQRLCIRGAPCWPLMPSKALAPPSCRLERMRTRNKLTANLQLSCRRATRKESLKCRVMINWCQGEERLEKKDE